MRPAAEAPPRPASRRDFALGLTFVLLAFVGLVRAFAPHTVDDAWITFRYSRMWAEGHGPVFNPGEHVEGYSNFLLVALLAPIIRNAGPDAALPVAKGAGLVSALLAIVATGLLARRAAKSERWADVAGIAAAAIPAISAQRAPAAARRASRPAPRIASRPEARPMAFAAGSAASGPA